MSNIQKEYQKLSLPGKLIAINFAVYAATQLYALLTLLFCVRGYAWQNYLSLPSNLSDFLMRPWSLLTYMFVHADIGQQILHIVFNMLWLSWFGDLFLRHHTGRQFLGVYLMGGLFSGLFFLLVYNVFPYFAIDRNYVSVIGASGAIFGLVVAAAMSNPDEMLSLNLIVTRLDIKLKWLAIVVVALSFLSVPTSDNTGGLICHVGGALWGAIFGYYERKGKDITVGFNRMCDAIANLFKPRTRMKVSKGGVQNWHSERAKDMDYNQRRKEQEAKIDAILDKMRKSGYNGLTEEEKQTLFNASKK